ATLIAGLAIGRRRHAAVDAGARRRALLAERALAGAEALHAAMIGDGAQRRHRRGGAVARRFATGGAVAVAGAILSDRAIVGRRGARLVRHVDVAAVDVAGVGEIGRLGEHQVEARRLIGFDVGLDARRAEELRAHRVA